MKNCKLDCLSKELVHIINDRENPFKKINVLVPSYSLKSYFKAYWLKNNKNNVLMNVYFYTIDNLLESLVNSNEKLLTSDLITLYILEELYSNINNYKTLSNYYNNNSINFNKLYDISKMLSDLYIEYENDLYDLKSSSIYSSDEQKLFNIIESKAKKDNVLTRKDLIKNINNTNNIFVSFGFNQYTKLEEELINKLNISSDFNLQLINNKEINSLKIITAPSKIREIEGIHTEICKILLDENNTYSDILVLCPKVSEYRSIIRQVFHQDNVKYPSLTRTINAEANVATNITNVLVKLKEIVKKQYYSSLDFIELLSNSLIKKNRHLSDDDIKVIKDILVNLNIKRENINSNTIKDFTYLKTRLLLNQVLDINILDHNITNINNKDYIPFNSISLNETISCVIVDTINDLNKLIEFYNNYKNKVDIGLFKEQLDIWFSNLDSNGGEKNSDYQALLNDLENYKNIITCDLSIDILFEYLKDRSLSKAGSNDNYFLNGITFANFDYNALIEAKYIFLIGCDNNSYNTNLTLSELDIRDHEVLKENYKTTFENAFILQASLAKNNVFISYVSEDLKTEEEIYPSNLIDNIIKEKEKLDTLKEYKNKYKDELDKYEDIPLDETRSNSKLFTKREEINKKYYNDLKGNINNISINQEINNNTNNINSSSNGKAIEVKLNEIRDFLNEPYSFWMNKLFDKENEVDNILNDKFESFDIDSLISYNIVKDLTINKLKGEDDDKIKQKYILQNKLPMIKDEFTNKSFENSLKTSDTLYESKKDYKIKLFDNIQVDNYLIKFSNEILINENSNPIHLSLIKANDNKFKNFIELYLYALVYVCQSDKKECTIHLDTGYKKAAFNEVTITCEVAKKRLINIINKMFESVKNLKFFNYNKANDNKPNPFDYSKYSNLESLTKNDGPWGYFNFKDLVNKYNINGLTYEKLDFEDAKNECEKVIYEYSKFFDENISGDKVGE